MKSGVFKITAIVSATALALLLGACSDDGSGTTNVSHGELSIPIPDGLAEDSVDVKYDTTWANDDIDSTSIASSSSDAKEPNLISIFGLC